MKINPIKKRIFIDSLLLAVTMLLVLVTGKDSNTNKKEPYISPRYLLSGSRVEGNPESIFDFYDTGNNEYAVSLKDSVKTTQTGTIEVPAMYQGRKVTGIWHNAFHGSPASSITFESPNNITVIDFEAFFYSSITTITIPYSVTAIGDAAFYSCNNLTTATFVNSSQTSSGGGACSCDTPTEEEDDENVEYSTLIKIPSYCFFKCEALETVTFPTSLQEIGEDAFNGCRSIDSPLFFQRIKIIRSRAFQGCTGLTSVYIPKTLFEDANGAGIEPHAFNFCDTSLEFVFCGTDAKIDAWLANHPNWGWRVNSNPSGNLARYSITRRETGDSYFTSDWSYSVDGDGNVTLKSYNGPTPSQDKGFLISIPDTMPGEPANNKVRRIDVGVFNPTVKAALRRLYLPTTLWVIENKMFADGYSNLFIIDDNRACASDGGYSSNDYPGRIDLSGLTELEFIGVHSFARSGKGLAKKTRIKSLHLPANLRSIGDEAFGVFQERMLPNVTEFTWDFDESTSRLETIGADCFYGIGIDGSGQIQGNGQWKTHTSSTIVFPKTFKYFGILPADETRYRNQETNPFNFQLYNGEAEKGAKWERPAHAFIGCSLISTVIFKGETTDSTKTTDLLIPLQTFVYNESLHTIIFEERIGHYITFHTQQQSNGKFDYSQESIGGNSGRGGNDFRGEPFLQTIILPNKQTKLRFQKFAFHANSRAAMYFSGAANTNIFSDKKDGVWKNLSFDSDNTDMTRAPYWKTIGDETWTSAGNNDGKGYYGYCFFPNAKSTSAYSNSDSYNSFSINQEIPTYYNVHYSDTFQLSNGSVNVEVGGGSGCKELVIDNKVTTEPSISYPSYCAYVCETDTTRPSGHQNIATMSKYLYDIKESDRDSSIRRNTLKKTTARVLDTVTINNTSYEVVKIGDSAFSASFCDSVNDNALGDVGTFDDLRYVELPDSIESIGEYAFIRCYGVEKISAYTSGSAAAADYEMPSSLRFIGKNAFLFSGIKEVLKIPEACRFYENKNATTRITSVFANCLSLRKITFTTSNDRSTSTTYTDYYETTTYTSAGGGTYTSALYSTDNAGVAQNKNKLLVVLNRDAADVNKASADHSSNPEGTVSGGGIKFDGTLKSGEFLFGAYKMGMWIKELKYQAGSSADGAQPLFSPVGKRSNHTLEPLYLYLYTNHTNNDPFEKLQCDLDTIEGDVIHMPQYALKGCENLATVKLPNEPGGSIPNGLFSEATSADFITSGSEGSVPGVMDLSATGYTSIGKEAIKGNTTITKFIAPSVANFTVGESAFQGCKNLTTLDLSRVTGTLTINTRAFASTGVNGVNIIWPASPCTIKIEGTGAFSSCTDMTSISLPTNTSATLGSETFKGCTSLTTVTVNGVSSPITKFNSSAFSGCTSLTNFDFSKFTALTTIGDSAFASTGSLSPSGVVLPSSVTSLGASAFNASKLTSITFNSSSISIGNLAFQNCTLLQSVVFTNSSCTWSSSGYGQGMFNGCTSLTELQLPIGYDINNSKYSGNGTEEKNYFIYGSGNVKLFTYRKFTTSTSISNNGWRKYNSTGSEATLYFYLSSDAIDDLTSANVIDNNGVNNTTTNFWTTDASGHAIALGTVDSYSGGVVTFSSGYTFDTTNGFQAH